MSTQQGSQPFPRDTRDPVRRLSGRRRIAGLLAAAIALLAAVLALWAALEAAGVRLVSASPADGARDLPVTTALRLRFSRPMDAASLESHLKIEPPTRGGLDVVGRTAIFRPLPALAPATTYTVTLQAGATSQEGRPLRAGDTWRFTTRAPQLLYLGRPTPGAGLRQLFVAPLDGTPPRALTDHPHGVWDYAVHPQGEAIIYSVQREDGGTDLWRMDRDGGDQRLLLACPGAACLHPAWSPAPPEGGAGSELLAYERRELVAGAPNLDPKAGRIWLLDLRRGRERPLFDYDVSLHSPVWSPDGQRLAYASPILPGVEVYDLESNELVQFANQWGAAPEWSPDGRFLVLPELFLAGEDLVVRLTRIDLAPGPSSSASTTETQVLDISGDDESVKDVGPAWSPGGGWIAFGRQFLDQARWTPGRQIWLTRPDGSEAYGLAADLMADHWNFAWRPDGGALAYARGDLSQGVQPVPEVSVWLFDFVRGQAELVAADGVLPKWLP